MQINAAEGFLKWTVCHNIPKFHNYNVLKLQTSAWYSNKQITI